MTASEFLASILNPGIAWCEAIPGWDIPFDDRALVLMLAIAGQESSWKDRVQGGAIAAAHGFAQMERAGGVAEVLQNPKTALLGSGACKAAGTLAFPANAWGLMATEKGDGLGVAFVRLLLWPDRHPLPSLGDEEGAWHYYVRNWKPGAVTEGGHRAAEARQRWHSIYPQAIAAIQGSHP